MRETSTPLGIDTQRFANITELITARAARSPEAIAFEVREGDGWRGIPLREFMADVRSLAKGLVAQGLAVGESVAILGETSYAWACIDLAAWFAGGVVVPIYDTSAPEQIETILRESGAVCAFGGNDERCAALRDAFARLAVDAPVTSFAALDQLRARGSAVTDGALDQRAATLTHDSIASIVFTSGSTAASKGVLLTHGNFVGQVLAVASAYGEVVHDEGSTVIFLPLAHVLARGLELVCLASGMRITFIANPADLVPALPELQPTFLVVVPRVLQKVEAAIAQKAAAAHLTPIWRAARATAIARGQAVQRGFRPPLWLRIRYRLFDRLFFRRIRALLGGKLDYFLVGAAPLERDLNHLFTGIGIPVIEGYGLTETTAPLSGTLPGATWAGSVGVPMPGSAVRIADDGEVLGRGLGVSPGYTDAALTEQAFTDGWFHTGDLGELDAEGRLTLTGRKSDLIVTAGGKNVQPTAWEQQLEADPLIEFAMMIGDDRPFLTAVAVVDAAELGREPGPAPTFEPELAPGVAETRDTKLRARVGERIRLANEGRARPERVQRFAVIRIDPARDASFITATRKLRRANLLAALAPVVAELYAGSDPRR